MLLQEDKDGIDHPVCCFSQKFKNHQLNYSTIEKEALDLLLELQQFEVYLGSIIKVPSNSVPTTMFPDHNALVFRPPALVLVASGFQY